MSAKHRHEPWIPGMERPEWTDRCRCFNLTSIDFDACGRNIKHCRHCGSHIRPVVDRKTGQILKWENIRTRREPEGVLTFPQAKWLDNSVPKKKVRT